MVFCNNLVELFAIDFPIIPYILIDLLLAEVWFRLLELRGVERIGSTFFIRLYNYSRDVVDRLFEITFIGVCQNRDIVNFDVRRVVIEHFVKLEDKLTKAILFK